MESEAKIRHLHFVQDYSIGELIKKTGLSRNTIRRVLRADKAGRNYHRSEQPKPKLGDYAEVLESWLIADNKLSRKERRTAAKYHTQLRSEGYQGAYDSVQRYVKDWKTKQRVVKSAYVPLIFDAGDAYQFDWSEETVEIAKVVCKLKVAQFRLSHSRKFFLAAYFRETQEMLFDAHNKAFAFFGGLCQRGIYDNMKTAVTTILKGKERVFNLRFLALMDHYLIDPVACSPASGWEKGQIENQVDNVRDWVFRPRLKFESLNALNVYLIEQCEFISDSRKHPTFKDKTISEVFSKEQLVLRELKCPFEAYKEENVSVSSTI
jgi:transposase